MLPSNKQVISAYPIDVKTLIPKDRVGWCINQKFYLLWSPTYILSLHWTKIFIYCDHPYISSQSIQIYLVLYTFSKTWIQCGIQFDTLYCTVKSHYFSITAANICYISTIYHEAQVWVHFSRKLLINTSNRCRVDKKPKKNNAMARKRLANSTQSKIVIEHLNKIGLHVTNGLHQNINIAWILNLSMQWRHITCLYHYVLLKVWRI